MKQLRRRVRENTGILSSPKCKVAISAIFVTMFLFAFVLAQPATACEQTPQPGTYQDISVQDAHQMIMRDHHNQILILDVRYQCEYNLGHLYGAVLMPYDQLQANISKFQVHKNQVIVVYCKTGVRSTIASEILANNGFARVYNMVGGIFAWIQAGYQINSTYHYATVNVIDQKVLTHIEPLLLLQTGAPPCTQNQTCQNSSESGNITNFQSIVLEQNENHTVTRVMFDINGTAFVFTVDSTLLWSYKEDTDGYNRSASFTSTEITGQNLLTQFHSLGYLVQCAKYNLTVMTVLRPLNSEAYNASSSMIDYAPAENPVTSLELVHFNSSVTLSQEYAVLGEIAGRIGKLYDKSQDENLRQLGPRYMIIDRELGFLSKLVSGHLQEYDLPIVNVSAALMDLSLRCIIWIIGCIFSYAVICGGCCFTMPPCCVCLTLVPGELACELIGEAMGACP
jgi:rhodanese-related sulfurtransferase